MKSTKKAAIACVLSLLSLSTVEAVLSQADKDTLLQLHNQARRATGGADLYEMVWDDTIAANAQAYADTCPGSHSATTSRPGLGENLAWGWPSRTPTSAMDGWVQQEIGYFNYGNSNWCTSAGECRHYTQIVWSSTYKLGCGKTSCGSISGYASYGAGDAYVCQYGPAGNIVGSQPYALGTPCSQCSGTCDNGLCVKATTCQAGYLTIAGASILTNINGLYGPGYPATINGKPHYSGDNYHIYWRSADSRWLIDTDTTDSNGYIGYVYDTAATPDLITHQWNVWPQTGSSFPVDPTMKITACSTSGVTTAKPVATTAKPVATTTTAKPAVTTTPKPAGTTAPTTCPTGAVKVVGSARLPAVNGVYTLVSTKTYKQQGGTGTLYYVPQNGGWVIDNDWQPTSVFGYVTSTATNPTTITATWQVYPGSGSVFLPDPTLKIQTCS